MLVSHGSNFLKGLPRIFVLCMISFPIKTEFHFADPVQPCIVLSSSVLTSGLECATAEMGGNNQRRHHLHTVRWKYCVNNVSVPRLYVCLHVCLLCKDYAHFPKGCGPCPVCCENDHTWPILRQLTCHTTCNVWNGNIGRWSWCEDLRHPGPVALE